MAYLPALQTYTMYSEILLPQADYQPVRSPKEGVKQEKVKLIFSPIFQYGLK